MLKIKFPEQELFDESTKTVITVKSQELQFEHSLVSISKWEAKWHKPYIGSNKSPEEILDYFRCMCMTSNADPNNFIYIPDSIQKVIQEYIDNPMTATTIRDDGKKGKHETITSEIIYYWMIANNIPLECQKWHLNRLMMLINVCAIKNNPDKKKMGKREILSHNAALNAARKKQLNTTG